MAGEFSISLAWSGQEPDTPTGESFAAFYINLNVASGEPSPGSVQWSAQSETATAGDDFAAVSGTAHFPSGLGSVLVEVPVRWDGVGEWTETFRVVLTGATGDNTIAVDSATTQIFDSPLPVVNVFVEPAQIDEGTEGEFVFQRAPAHGPLTVYYMFGGASTASSGDYSTTLCGGSFTFADGQLEYRAGVDAIDDTALENMETLIVNLLPTPGAGPPQYQISSSSATLEIHDGEHGVVDTLFTVEWEDEEEDDWNPVSEGETLWSGSSIRWLPDIPEEVVEDVTAVSWFKRLRGTPEGAWEHFSAAAAPLPATGDPDAGDWDIKFVALYGPRSSFESKPKRVPANKIWSIHWERDSPAQEFRDEADQSIVFPEFRTPTSTTVEDKVKVVVTLKAVVPPGPPTVVKLKAFDPDHAYDPTLPQPADPTKRFDPNDDFDIPLEGLPFAIIKANDNRHTGGGWGAGGGGGIGGELFETTMTIPAGQQSEGMQFKITDAQPGNNFVAVVSEVKPGEAMPGVDRVKFKENDQKKLVYNWRGADHLLQENYFTLPLTVWRTLWVELDSMTAADPATDPFDLPTNHQEYDADLGDLPNPDISLLSDQFRPANIEIRVIPEFPIVAGHDLKDNRFFYHYVADAPPIPGGANGPRAAADDVKDVITTNQFWAIHLIGGYEWDTATDFDDELDWTLGISLPGTNSAYVFFETIRDRAVGDPYAPNPVDEERLRIRTALHEAGHLMGAVHGNTYQDGVMNRHLALTETNDALVVFKEKHYAIFQAKPKPEWP